MKPPTVWGIITMKPHDIILDQPAHVSQCRAIVAAPSKAAAMRALNDAGFYMSVYTFNGYAGETGNDREVSTATARPGHVFITSVQGRGEFVDLTVRAEKQRAEQTVRSLAGLTIETAKVVGHSPHCDSVNVLRLTMTNGTVYEVTGGYGGYTGQSCDEYVETITVEKVPGA